MESTDYIFDKNAIFNYLVHLGSLTIEWSEGNQNSYGFHLVSIPYMAEISSNLTGGVDSPLEWLHNPDPWSPVIILQDIVTLLKVYNLVQDFLSSYQMSGQCLWCPTMYSETDRYVTGWFRHCSKRLQHTENSGYHTSGIRNLCQGLVNNKQSCGVWTGSGEWIMHIVKYEMLSVQIQSLFSAIVNMIWCSTCPTIRRSTWQLTIV